MNSCLSHPYREFPFFTFFLRKGLIAEFGTLDVIVNYVSKQDLQL
jgi:hypothetical protein